MLGECSVRRCQLIVGYHELFDGVVFLDCCVGQVIEREYHFFGEVVIDGRMGLVSKRASGETADVTVFLEGSRPMCFPIGPRLVRLRAAVPFFPSVSEIATLDGVFGPGGDHGGFGDGDACIGGKILSVFLFTSVNGERQGRVNALEESRHVTVDFVLPDVAIAISNMV